MTLMKSLSHRMLLLLMIPFAGIFALTACSSDEAGNAAEAGNTSEQQASQISSPSVLIVGGHADNDFDRWFNQEDTAIIGETGADVSYTDDPDSVRSEEHKSELQ